MRFNNFINEGKGILSPLLKSVMKKPEYGTSEEEAYAWDKTLSKFADKDNKLSLSIATAAGSDKGQYYLTVMRKDKQYDDIKKKVVAQIQKSGVWKVTKTKDKGNEGYWIYFTKK